jgi:hypothetical protein
MTTFVCHNIPRSLLVTGQEKKNGEKGKKEQKQIPE